jgi:hypothetical protein
MIQSFPSQGTRQPTHHHVVCRLPLLLVGGLDVFVSNVLPLPLWQSVRIHSQCALLIRELEGKQRTTYPPVHRIPERIHPLVKTTKHDGSGQIGGCHGGRAMSNPQFEREPGTKHYSQHSVVLLEYRTGTNACVRTEYRRDQLRLSGEPCL